MQRRALPLLCLFPAVSAPAAPALPAPALPGAGVPVAPLIQEDEDLDAILEERVREAEELSIEEVWNEAQTVAALVGDDIGDPFDDAVDRALARPHSGRGVLFLAATRLLGEDVDWELVVRALEPLLRGDDEQVARAAADLVGNSDVDQQESELRKDLAEVLLEVGADGGRSPQLRVECAVAAYQIGLGSQTPRARTVMYDFLESADPNLRAQGALAMAHLGLIEGVPAVEGELERLAGLPGERGRLARAYLKQMQIRRFKDTELRRAREHASQLTLSGASSPDLERVERVIRLVQDAHIEGDKFDREEMIEAALDGLLHALDRHSAYFSPDTYEKFEQELEAEYGGIGAYVGEDPDDRLFTITRPIYSGPAYKAGLGTDDKIVRIEEWPTIGEDVDEIIKRLKGRPGTEVKLYVWRRGMDPTLIERPTEDMALSIVRDQITIPPVHAEMLPGQIGLVELTTFSRVASQELEREIRDLLGRGMRGLILDLRNNTGGLLTEARNVGDLFLAAGETIVSTRSRVYAGQTYKTRRPAIVPADLPVVVLINRFSASASEIVSGALQDHGRATLVGQRSFGKGSVQNLIQLPGEEEDEYSDENGNRRYDNWETITKDHDGDGEFDYAPRIKLTIEEYLLPTGRSIHRKLDEEGNLVSEGGVEPDVEVGPTRREQWRLIEMRKVQETRGLRDWVRQHFDEDRALFERLAYSDLDDETSYPGFDELYESLDTVLSRDDVRFLLRMEVRRVVQDSRGHAFPYGDFQEDVQLQKAIAAVLEELGQTPEQIADYAATFDEVGEDGIVHGTDMPLASMSGKELDDALALIAEAEGYDDDAATKAKLRELSDLIRSIRKN